MMGVGESEMDKLISEGLTNGRVGTLVEALPYIRRWSNKTVVVKYGGAAMKDPQLQRNVMQDLVLLHYVGVRIVLVHGGGPKISQMMEQLGHEPRFVGGLRVTDEATMEIAQMVLVGSVGQELVSLLNEFGGRAVGLSGKDARLIAASKKECAEGDLGFVGEIESIDTRLIDVLNDAGYIVVLSPIGSGEACESYNINADTVACAVAMQMRAEKLVVLSDVPGVMTDVNDPDSLISEMDTAHARELIEDGTVSGGMIPKVQAAVDAIESGVNSVHMIDGRIKHSLLVELFTEGGIGTMIVAEGEADNDQ